MAFTTKITSYAGDLTGLDATNALRVAVDHTLGVVKKANPMVLSQFSHAVRVELTLGTGYNLRDNNVFDVVKVERMSRIAQPVSPETIYQVQDSASIYYAQEYSPAYTIDFESNLRIFPDTSATKKAVIYVIFDSNGKTVDDNAETIKDNAYNLYGVNYSILVEKFPDIWKDYVILHASELLLLEKMVDFSKKLPTDLDADTTLFDQIADVALSITYTFPSADYQDALDKAKSLMDSTGSIGGDGTVLSAQQWLEDEDEDMVRSTLEAVQAELGRAGAILGEFNAEINAKVTQKSQVLQEFQANIQKKMGLYDKIIQKLSTDYQWVASQIQLVQAKKQEFIQAQGGGGMSDNPEEGQI
ncbi:MAG: hypothetical protein CMM33_05020 [Rhodospirillaceae bacterium]|nr:hypothetical protein [Rhodospirillaceae bacterium]